MSRWLVLASWIFTVGCAGEAPFPSSAELEQIRGLRAVQTPPRSPTNGVADNLLARQLGARLFNDPRLSSCQTVACATCHRGAALDDDHQFSKGCGGVATRNTPAVLNVSFGASFMWDGRADTLWGQALLPLLSPVEMNGHPAQLRALVETDYPEYAQLFNRTVADEPNDDRFLSNLGKALEAHMRTQVKMVGPFDAQLTGFLNEAEAGTAEKSALYAPLKAFVRDGQCITCHQGPTFSDEKFHNIALKEATADLGRADGRTFVQKYRFVGSGVFSDDPAAGAVHRDALLDEDISLLDGAFKTPSLRNVERTAPYMHDGSLASLEDVVEHYDRGGDPVGSFPGIRSESLHALKLSAAQKQTLVDFLRLLTADGI